MTAAKHEDAFWMVWCVDGSFPRVQHGAKGDAEREAQRLARANPGKRFVVLESRSAFEANDLTRVAYEHPIPF